MKRVNSLFQHPVYQEHFQQLQIAEKERIFCNHTMEHFLDVARLMYIYDLENGTRIPLDILYAAALLHDIGRNLQYQSGIPHDAAGAELAGLIMADCSYSEDEIRMVQHAISCHRKEKNTQPEHTSKENSSNNTDEKEPAEILAEYLYRADKKSRNCFSCPAFSECNWSSNKKNMYIDR